MNNYEARGTCSMMIFVRRQLLFENVQYMHSIIRHILNVNFSLAD